MQIQRIQSLYIFVAIIAMAVFVTVPYGEVVHLASGENAVLYTMSEYGVLIPVGAVILLLMAALCFFRNLPLQRTVTMVSLMLTLSIIAVVCFTLYKQASSEGIDAHFTLWDILLPVAAVLEILAIGGINHDIKLLKSYDRLR